MKKILYAFFFALLFNPVCVCAQLPDGSMAPPFVAVDTEGNSWELYELLGEGKIVVLNFFGAWDEYAWDYQQSGELQDLNAQYGPQGTGELVILNIEAEQANSAAQLSGPAAITGDPATQTQGDWLTGNPIPVIDDAAVAESFSVNFLPTVYAICPDGILTQQSQVTAEVLYQQIIGASCPVISPGLDPAISSAYSTASCGGGSFDVTITLKNLGTEPLTFVYFVVNGIQSPFGYSWTGNLETYQSEEILFSDLYAGSSSDVVISITSSDTNPENSIATVSAGAEISTQVVKLELGLDYWADETSWEIRNDEDSVLFSGGDYTISYEYINQTFTLPGDGCYAFYLYDARGDGLHGSQWGGYDGSCYLKSLDGSGNTVSTIFGYDGSYDFSSILNSPSFIKTDFHALPLSIDENSEAKEWALYPNPSQGMVTLSFLNKSGLSPQVTLWNMQGEIIHAEQAVNAPPGRASLPLDFTSVADGIYFMKVEVGGKSWTQKLVIQK